MTDGDKIRGFQRIYQKPREVLFEEKANNNECARAVIKSLLQDMKYKGDIPIKLAKSMGGVLTQFISDAGDIIFADWFVLRQNFNRLVEQADGSHYLKELILRAGMVVLNDLEYGREINFNSPSQAILRQYMTEVYETGFKECISPEEDKYLIRLEQIEPLIFAAIDKWAKKADEVESMRKLRLPPLQKKQEIDNFDDDLGGLHTRSFAKKIDDFLQTAPDNLQITNQDLKKIYLPVMES